MPALEPFRGYPVRCWQGLKLNLLKHYQNEKYRQKERFYPCLAVCTPNRAIIQRMPQKSVGKYQTQKQNEHPDSTLLLSKSRRLNP